MRNYFFTIISIFAFIANSNAQSNDSLTIRRIYSEALANGKGYTWLDSLSNRIGARLSGSVQAEQGVNYVKKELDQLKLDRVFLQDAMVPHWVRGEKENAFYKPNTVGALLPVSITALGNSIATPQGGLYGPVVEIKNFDELAKKGKKEIEGKIVFYNHPFDQTFVNAFRAYAEAVPYRWAGASRAAYYGAKAVVVRSMAISVDDFPHTGSMGYADTVPKIPACAISTKGADELSDAIKKYPQLQFFFKQSCEMKDSVLSHNVVGEIRGSEYPEEIIIVGGHLDSWDLGTGASDDGAGVVQSMEMLNLFKVLNIKPKRTIRCVAFMNEENGGRGGAKYAELAKQNNEKTIAAIETDAGGFSPRGFTFKGDSMQVEKIFKWKKLFEQYGLHIWEHGYGGADINHLEKQGTMLIGLSPDSQRYFDYHHAASDTFDKVNRRELELGAASMAALVYLISEYGLK